MVRDRPKCGLGARARRTIYDHDWGLTCFLCYVIESHGTRYPRRPRHLVYILSPSLYSLTNPSLWEVGEKLTLATQARDDGTWYRGDEEVGRRGWILSMGDHSGSATDRCGEGRQARMASRLLP